MFRLFLIRLLLKLLGIPEINTDKLNDKKIDIWLWTILPQQGFQDYMKLRTRRILQEMGKGVPHEIYVALLYSLVENNLLLQEAKKGYYRVEKSRKEKIEAIKKMQEKHRKIIKPEEKSEPKKNENTNEQKG